MTVTKGPLGSPLPVGKTFPVLSNSPSGAGEDTHQFGVDADGVLISVVVLSVTGSVNVVVDTLGKEDERNVITFPSISSPTAEPVIRTAVNILSTIRVTVSYTGSCAYEIRARGISRGGAGANDTVLTVDFAPDATLPIDLTPLLVTNPTIENIILTTAGAEQAVAFPSGTKRFRFQAVNTAKLQYAYILGDSGTTFMTVFPGNTEEEENIDELASLTLYLQSNKDNTPVQLLFWT